MTTKSLGVETIREKTRNRERLSRDEGLYLLREVSVLDLGQLASAVR